MERAFLMGKALAALGVTGYSICGETYEDVFFPEGFTPPTKEAFEAELARLADPVPSSATRGQLIRVLHHIGKLAEVRDAVAQADVLIQELWLSPTFYRDDPLLRAVAATVGLTDRIDDLFRLSATM